MISQRSEQLNVIPSESACPSRCNNSIFERETLKFGDIVYLTGRIEGEDGWGSGDRFGSVVHQDSMKNYRDICIQAEGIANPTVYAIPLSKKERNSGMTLKLFRVEKCIYQLSPQMSLSKEVAKDYLKRNKGIDVEYGDHIQLCHLHSRRYLSFSTTPGHSDGLHRVLLGPRTGSSTLIQVRGEGKQGQPVYLEDPVELVTRSEFLDYYLSIKTTNGENKGGSFDLQASLLKFKWKLCEFSEYSGKKNEILTNMPFVLTHKTMRLNLTCEKTTAREWRDEIISPTKHGVNRCRGNEENQELILMNDRFDHQCYWMLEDLNEFEGGPVEFGKSYYLKHIHTNKYLGGDLTLKTNPEQTFILRLLQGSEDKLYSGAEIQVEIEGGKRIESGVEKMRQESLCFIPTPARNHEDKRRMNVEMSRTTTEKSVFEVHLVKEIVSFVMWTNNMMPAFRHYYSILESLPAPSSIYDSYLPYCDKYSEQTDTLQQSLKAIEELISDSSDLQDCVKKKQFLSIGFKLHIIVIDIANALIRRLKSAIDPWDRLMDRWEKVVEFPESYFDLIAAQMKKLFPAMLSLLNTIAKDNKWTCKALSKFDIQISELFPFNKNLVASLLSEVYRLINPSQPEKYFNRLCERLATVSSENIEEQTLYLSMIRKLSEENGEILLTSANILAEKYIWTDDPSFFLRILIHDDVPYIEFLPTEVRMTNEEFREINPAIMAEGDEIGKAICFSLIMLSGKPEYIEYVSEAILLMNTLCQSENVSAIEDYRSLFGFEIDTLLRFMKDGRLHLSFRASVMSLVDTLVLDKSRKIPFTTRQSNLSFRLEDVVGRVESEEQHFTHAKRAEVSDVVECCLKFWMRKDYGTDLFTYGTVALLKFLLLMLRMTYTLINYHFATPNFVRTINPSILDLLISLLSSQREFHAETHWVQQLSDVLENDYSNDNFTLMYSVKVVQDLTIRLIKLNFDMNLRSKLEQLLHVYYLHRSNQLSEENIEMMNDIRDVVLGTAQSIDISSKMMQLFRTSPSMMKQRNNPQEAIDILLKEPHIREFLCSAILSDMHLDSSTRQELMQLLYQILESNNSLMRMLKSVDLIEESEQIGRRKFLSEFAKDFNISKHEKVIREKLVRLKDAGERTRLGGLLEKFLCSFSLKVMKETLFKKMQNLARSYKIHYELVTLWKILSPKSEAFGDLMNLIGTALMNFCYGNEINRNELLKLIDSSFFTLTTPQIPYLIQEVCNFEHLPHIEAELGLTYILEKCVMTNTDLLPGLEWIRAIISYRGSEGYKRDMQTLACFRIIERLTKLNMSLLNESEDVSCLVLVLADCANRNAITISHCRKLMRLKVVIESIKIAKSPLSIRAWVCFFHDVYFSENSAVTDSILQEVIIALLPWLDKVIQSFPRLEILVRAGGFEQIWDEVQPYRYHSAEERKKLANEAQLWQMLSYGEQWQRNTGIFAVLHPIVGYFVTPSGRLKKAYRHFLEKMTEIHNILLAMRKEMLGYEAGPFLRSSIDLINLIAYILNTSANIDSLPITAVAQADIASSHKKMISDASTVMVTTDSSLPQKESSLRSSEGDGLLQNFVGVAVGVIGEYSKDYHITFKEMALVTYPMILFQKKYISGNKRKELIKMLKFLNQKIGPDLKFMIFDLLDAIIRDIPDKRTISNMFMDSGLVEAAVSAIVEQPNFRLMKSAITFLNGLFEKQSAEFLNWFLEKIKASGAYLRLFSQLKAELNCSLDRILMRASHPKQEQHLTAYERDIFSGLLQSGSSLSDVFELADDYSINLVRFMQLCCDNCNLLFQEFMHTQIDPLCISRGSVNVVDTIANYVIVMSQYESLFTDDTEAKETIIVCFEALLDFVTGPCTLNQNKLGRDIQFLLAINTVLKESASHKDDDAWVLMYSKTLDFLMTLFEGSPSQEVLDSLIQYIDLAFLMSDATEIYTNYIQGKEKDLLLETGVIAPIAYVGFKIAIVICFFKYYFPKHLELAGFSTKKTGGKPGRTLDPRKFGVINDVPKECISFFYSFIGYVEIARNDRIESHFFLIPFMCKFLTEETREDIIIKVDRSSHHEKMDSFLDMIRTSHIEMRHQQNLYRVRGLKYFSEGWQLYGWIAFILVIVMNILVLDDTNQAQIADGDLSAWNDLDLATGIINICQMLMMALSYAFFLVEYFPNIVAGEIVKRTTLEFPDYSSIRHNESLLMTAWSKKKNGVSVPTEHTSKMKKVFLLLKHHQNLYFMSYITVSMCCFWWRFLFCFLLFDILQRSPELGNILKAITLNKKQLILTTVFWILVLYVFSGVALYQFSEYYSGFDTSLYCSTLWECFVSTLHNGVRYGGGIGDGLAPVTEDDPRYYARVIFDLLFFAMVILIIQNIIFGIIVNTFGQLRDMRQQMLKDVNQQCFICGCARNEIERSGSGWSHHFLNEHSPFAYLAFIKYLDSKEMNDCNGLEKFVKEKLLENDSGFFPTSSRFMTYQAARKNPGEEEETKKKKNTMKHIKRLGR